MKEENYHIGDYITLLESPDILVGYSPTGEPIYNKSSLVGIPLKIIAIHFPFLALETYTPQGQPYRFSLDSRKFNNTIKVSPEYALALLPQQN